MLEIGINTNIDLGMRQMALTVIQWMAAQYVPKKNIEDNTNPFPSKAKLLLKHQLLPSCLQVSFAVCTEGSEEDDEEDDDGLYLSAHEFGCQMIDHFARVLPSSQVWDPCLAYVQKLGLSQNPLERRASVDVLTVCPL